MARPTIDHEIAFRRVVYAAIEGDQEAAAWLRGEGYIRIMDHDGPALFVRFDEERNGREAVAWRVAVFERDGYRCQHCGARGRLHAHHVAHWARERARRLDVDNGITLCPECHALQHPDHANLVRRARYHAAPD